MEQAVAQSKGDAAVAAAAAALVASTAVAKKMEQLPVPFTQLPGVGE